MSGFKKFVSIMIVLVTISLSGVGVAAANGEGEKVPLYTAHHEDKLRDPAYTNDIVAIVNDKIITMAKLMREVSRFESKIRAESRSQAEFKKKLRECQEFFLNALVERILIVSDFEEKGGKIPETYEKREYEAYVRNVFNGDRLEFSKFLREHGQSVREFKKEMKEVAIVNFVINKIMESQEELSPAKIKEYYDSNIDEFIIDRQIFVRELSLKKADCSDEEWQKKISSLNDGLHNGVDINGLRKNSHIGEGLKSADIGWVAVDDMIAEFANASRGLVAGDIAGPIFFENKVSFLLILDEQPAKKISLDEAKQNIEKKLSSKYSLKAKEDFINKLRAKSYIRTFL